tara:strand:- start:357 stop:1010 length:654 start_codon:yes stop_codon:yes gene_type:complete
MDKKMSIKSKYKVKSISKHLCKEWLLHKHYAKRIPSISYAFGLFNSDLVGILTIGKPASNFLCIGVCGESNSKYVYELNRLCVNDELEKNVLSYFVSQSLKMLNDLILVSYADTSMNHNGYIYQATNWIYTGLSAKAIDKKIKGSNKHARHNNIYEKGGDYELVERSRKHRYLYFIGNKKTVKKWKKELNYKIQDYPKGENKRYDASYKPTIQRELF